MRPSTEELAGRKCDIRSSIVNAITFPWTKLARDMFFLETFPFHRGKVIAEKEDPSAYIFILSYYLALLLGKSAPWLLRQNYKGPSQW